MRYFLISSFLFTSYAFSEVVTALECHGDTGIIYAVGDWSNSDELKREADGRFGYADKAENYLLEYTNVVTSHDEAGQFTAQAYVRTDGNGWLEVAKLHSDHEEPEVFYGQVLIPRSKSALYDFSPGVVEEYFGFTEATAQFVDSDDNLGEMDATNMKCGWKTYESHAVLKETLTKQEGEL